MKNLAHSRNLKIKILFAVLMSMVGANAYSLEVKNADGVTIYYNYINNSTELEVTYEGSYYYSYSNEYTGNVVIPSEVTCNNKTYKVTRIGYNAFRSCSGLTSVTIPNSVTSIGESAFYGCSGLTSVTIPNSVTSIGNHAFYDCSKLTSVTIDSNSILSKEYTSSINIKDIFGSQVKAYSIGNNVNTIGDYAFYYCDGLTSITIPNSVTSIGSSAFSGCSRLTSVTIPNSVTSIGQSAFRGCSGLTSITIPNSVTSIESYAFSGCSGLTSITIPNSVTSIGYEAFYGCSGLTSVTIPNSVTSIGESAFSGTAWYNNQPDGLVYVGKVAYKYKGTMPSNTSVSIKDGTLGIGGSAFSGCSGLTSVTIPNSVTNIGIYAFSGCSGLTSVTIPNSVTSIGSYAFSGCSGLTSITIPNSVTSIGYEAFSGCSGLTSVIIPNSVTSIGDLAFSGCSGLTSVTLHCKEIGSWFSNKEYIKKVVIGNEVTSIGSFAFSGCSGLTSVTIGTGVLSIGSNCFKNAKPKKVIWLTNTPPSGYSNAEGTVNYVANEQYTSLSNKTVYPFLSSMFDVDGVKYVPVSPSERTCDAIDCNYDESAENVNIGNTVSYKGVSMTVKQVKPYVCCGNRFIKKVQLDFSGEVSESAFQNCVSLETVTLGDNVASIGENAFNGCEKLKSISIPDATTSVGSWAFSGCSGLKSILIGANVKTINDGAFSSCPALPSISIPQSVSSIGNFVFRGCTSLKTVTLEDKADDARLTLGSNGSSPLFANCPLESVYIGRNISYSTSSSYGYSPFYRNTSLQSVVITDRETEISENEFYGCTNLKNVTIGEGVTTIGKWAFSGCSSLESFAFGSSVKTIGQEAFSDCTAMTHLVSKAKTPPTCGTQALDDINKWSCTLSVPEGCNSVYQQADQWKDFFFIDNNITVINALMNTKGISVKDRYTLDGKRLTQPQRGLNIVRMSDGTTKKVVVR